MWQSLASLYGQRRKTGVILIYFLGQSLVIHIPYVEIKIKFIHAITNIMKKQLISFLYIK